MILCMYYDKTREGFHKATPKGKRLYFTVHPEVSPSTDIIILGTVNLKLEGTSRYMRLLLAPAESFGLWLRLFLPFELQCIRFRVLTECTDTQTDRLPL